MHKLMRQQLIPDRQALAEAQKQRIYSFAVLIESAAGISPAKFGQAHGDTWTSYLKAWHCGRLRVCMLVQQQSLMS